MEPYESNATTDLSLDAIVLGLVIGKLLLKGRTKPVSRRRITGLHRVAQWVKASKR